MKQRMEENAFLDTVGLVWIPQVSQLFYPSHVALSESRSVVSDSL